MDNKKLIEILSNKLETNSETTAKLIKGLTGLLGRCGKDYDSISVAGFGTFEAKKRMERVAVHPASGKRLLVPPKIVLNLKPSTTLKQRING